MASCRNCGQNLVEGANFCYNCGTSVTVDEELKNDSKSVTSSKPAFCDKMKAKLKGLWHRLSAFGKMSSISVFIAAFLVLVAILFDRMLAVIAVAIQLAFVVVAILMKKNVIRVSKTWISYLAILLSFVLVIPYFALFKIDVPNYDKYNWGDVVLSEMLPKPESPYGKILSNSKERLTMRLEKSTKKQYNNYIVACKNKGFSVDAETIGDFFYAFNDNGCKLALAYSVDNSEIYIALEVDISNEESNNGNSQQDGNNLDYSDAESFEKALNNGTKVKGKTVKFVVNEYEPTSVLGINCWAGKHLNFISQTPVDVSKGDTVIGRILNEPTIFMDSWVIDYEVLSIDKKNEPAGSSTSETTEPSITEPPVTEPSTTKEPWLPEPPVTKPQTEDPSTTDSPETSNYASAPDSWMNLLEKHYEEVKKQFEDAGFTNVVCVAQEVDYDENNVFEGSVVNIAVGENGELCTFKKGAQWPKNVKIRIDYRVKPTKPNTSKIVLPKETSKLGLDFDSKGANTICYINVDGFLNIPKLQTWGSATVTDGVAEYLDYLTSLGFTVTVTNKTHESPWEGFDKYDTEFKVTGTNISWTMSLYIQSEYYVEYELDIHIQ